MLWENEIALEPLVFRAVRHGYAILALGDDSPALARDREYVRPRGLATVGRPELRRHASRRVKGDTHRQRSARLGVGDAKLQRRGRAKLVLRMHLLARHDPIPFIIRFIRTYNPGVWGILEDWGLEKFPLQFERERQFINIYRSHDRARDLSDEGFLRVLEFTRKAFEMALHFVAEETEGEQEEKEPHAKTQRR